jgi:hypothetical protein
MSRTFSMNSGSLESLNVSLRCGWERFADLLVAAEWQAAA